MPRLRLLGAAVVALAALPAVADSTPPAAFSPAQPAEFRSASLQAGEWTYTNGIWQAHGANTDGLHRTDYYKAIHPADADPTFITRDLYNAVTYDFFGAHRTTHNGDFELPLDDTRWPAGTGEVAALSLRADSDTLHVRWRWTSMPRPDAQIATLAFGTSSSPGTAWPAGAKLTSAHDAAITAWGTMASLTTGAATTPLTARHGDHVTEVDVPLSALPTGPWRLTGGSGLADPADPSHYWSVPPGKADGDTPGSGGPLAPTNVWGLLFADDQPWTFDELSQADQLARGTTTSTAVVDPLALQRGDSAAAPIRHGDLSRLLVSAHTGPDGIAKDKAGIGPSAPPALPIGSTGLNESWYYTGQLQTYAMHVPARYDGTAAWPLVVYLHGFTGQPEEPFHNPVGLVDEADKRGYLFASALGRGDYFYRGEGDLDVLELIADVSKHYAVDPSRIYLMGHSMGGYGTNNVAAHHPDLFAAVAPAEGTDSVDLSANLRNVPWFMMTAEEDLDFQGAEAQSHYDTLSALGYDATLEHFHFKTHEYSTIYDILPRLFDFFGSHRLVRDPAVVDYVKRPGDERPDLGLRYDSAYWASGLRAADSSKAAALHAESAAIPHPPTDPSLATRTVTQVDEHGPTMRSTADLSQTVPAAGPLSTPEQRLTVSTTNLSALALDTARAGLHADALITVQCDVPLALSLPDRTVSLSAGTTTVTL